MTGRCAGCGNTASSRKIEIHILTCDQFLALFKSTPQRCLDPQAEFERFKSEEDTPEARAVRRGQRLQQRFLEFDAIARTQADRWRPEGDILAD